MLCGRRLAAKSAGLHPVHRRFESCRPHQFSGRDSSGWKSAWPVCRRMAARALFSGPSFGQLRRDLVRSSLVGLKHSIDNREIRSSILLSATSLASRPCSGARARLCLGQRPSHFGGRIGPAEAVPLLQSKSKSNRRFFDSPFRLVSLGVRVAQNDILKNEYQDDMHRRRAGGGGGCLYWAGTDLRGI